MTAPIVEKIVSALMIPASALAPVDEDPRQVIAQSVTASGAYHFVVSSDFDGMGTDLVFDILEALDGDCRGQMVLILRFNDGADRAVTTPFWKAAPTGRNFRLWVTGIKVATSTALSALATQITSTYRTETDVDYWPRFRMLGMYGDKIAQKNISAFDPATDIFTTEAWDTVPVPGDAFLPVQPLKPSDVTYGMGNTSIPRELITDSLDQDGAVIGAQADVLASFSPEIRGLAAAAGDGVTANPPGEMHEALRALFTQNLDTGDADQGASTTTVVNVVDGTRFTQYSLALHELGDVFAIPSIVVNALSNIPAGHLQNAPALGDVIYAGANYRPLQSGHESISMLFWHSRALMTLLMGGLPELKATIEGDQISKYQFAYQFAAGLMADLDQGHEDTYDNSTPIPGKSNVDRVVLDGEELNGQVLSAEIMLQDAPTKKGAAFGAFENSDGQYYINRAAGISMVMQMEDSSHLHRYRAGEEVDFLIQAGRVPTATWALWAPRAQMIAAPEKGSADGIMQWTIQMGFLRPNSSSAAYTVAHF